MDQIAKRSRLTLLTAAITLLGFTAAWNWPAIKSDSLATSLAAVASAIGLAALAFGRKIWTDLEGRWAKSCADWLDARVRILVSRFRRTYYTHLSYRYRFFNVGGLRTHGMFTPELEHVFVELRVAAQNPQEANADPIRPLIKPGHHNIWHLLNGESNRFGCLAVIGAPGSGKTTLLQHLAVTFAQNRQRCHDRRCRAFVPVLLFLRDHVKAIIGDSPPNVAELATGFEKKEKTNPPDGWFEDHLNAGHCLVMLDGLDEVADPQQRQQVAAWVDKQASVYGNNRFIITSRPNGYQSNPLRQALVLEVQPFTLEQVKKFVHNWYLASEVASTGINDPGVRKSADTKAAGLMRRLHNAPTLSALAVNPLLLTMIAMVHCYRGALPGRRVELYAEICDVLLGHWQQAKGIASNLTAAQKRAVLQPLALRMMQRRLREISTRDAIEIIREPLGRVGGGQHDDPQHFLKEVHDRSGLLLEREAGVNSFAHLTFQEYLAASQLLERGDETALIPCVQDPWWHETIRLYAAQGDTTGIIQACLAAGQSNVTTLTLAYECANEGLRLDPIVRNQLQTQLIDGLDAEDEERRRLAAEVLLSLRLRHFLRLGESTEIDTSYISCAEYQLFIDEKVAHDEFRQPDHWSQIHFSKGGARQPIAGVRAGDAKAFCEWMTARLGSQGDLKARFRLPIGVEAESNPVQRDSTDSLFRKLQTASAGTWREDVAMVSGMSAEVIEQTSADLRHKSLSYLIRAVVPFFALIFTRVLSRVDQLGRDFERDGEDIRRIARERALHLAQDLARALDSKLDFSPDLDRDLDRDLARDLARDLTRDVARALDADLDREDDFEHAYAKAHTRACDLALALPRALETTVGKFSALDLDHTFDLTRSRGQAPFHTRNLALATDRYIARDRHLAGTRDCGLDLALRRARDLARDLARTRDLARARNIYFAVAWICQTSLEQGPPARKPWSQRIFWKLDSHRSLDATAAIRDDCLSSFLTLAWLEERCLGRLPAWEGIRLVRENVSQKIETSAFTR